MLRVLVSLGRTGSFSRTADELHLTQSAVSHAVRGVEVAAGVPLFVRHRRGATATAAGQEAIAAARRALDGIDVIARLGRASANGTVRLAAVISASARIAPPTLERLRDAHPLLRIVLLVGTDQEVGDWVASGAADLGLAYDIEGEAVLADEFFAIAAHGSQWLPSGPRVSVTALGGAPFIMSASGCDPMIRQLVAEHGSAPNVVLAAHDMGALVALVGADHGVSILPGLAFPDRWQSRVQRRLLDPGASAWLRLAQAAETSFSADIVAQALRRTAAQLGGRPERPNEPTR